MSFIHRAYMPTVLMLLCVLICTAGCDGERSGAVLMHPPSTSSGSPEPTAAAGPAPQALAIEQALAEIKSSTLPAGVEKEVAKGKGEQKV